MDAAGSAIMRLESYVIDPIIVVLVAAGMALFMYGLVEFLWHLKDGKDLQTGKNHMMWGIAGMFIMVSVWGILSLINNTFGFNFGNPDMSRINNIDSGANFGGY